MQVTRRRRWLIVDFERPQVMLSWAIHQGGKTNAKTVAWYQVDAGEFGHVTDPKAFLRQKLQAASIPDAVGLLTSANLGAYVETEKISGVLSATCIATVGLSNALRVGDPIRTTVPSKIGTINILCHVSMPLTEEAHLEALSLVAEARSAAVLEADIQSTQTGLQATGTGTDCIVMAAPNIDLDTTEPLRYVGKHTEAGHLIGQTVLKAMRRGIDLWHK